METLARAVVAVCAVVVAPITAWAQGPSFTLVGYPAVDNGSGLYALSADGSIAAGWSSLSPGGAHHGFTWSFAFGRNDFGTQAGMPTDTTVHGISGDGSAVVGGMNSAGAFRAFRWSGGSSVQDLGVLTNYTRAVANGASNDGSVAVGWCERGPNTSFDGQAFRWTAAGGMQGLGFARAGDFFSEATAVSRDGSTIVGWSANFATDGTEVPFTWTLSGGIHMLPGLGAATRSDRAFAVNNSGLIVVGSADNASGQGRWAMWQNGTSIDLGMAAGFGYGDALAVSDNGTVVAGTVFSSTSQAAGIWTLSTGVEPMANYLGANGVQIPSGWILTNCFAVSADGLTFAGTARSASGSQGFVATVPSPAGMLILLALTYQRRGR